MPFCILQNIFFQKPDVFDCLIKTFLTHTFTFRIDILYEQPCQLRRPTKFPLRASLRSPPPTKEDLKSRPKEKEKRRANEDESYFRRRQLFLVHFLYVRQHCTRAAKLNWSISSSPPTKIRCLYYPKKPFPHVLRRIRNKVKISSQSEISCINLTMTRKMYACISSKSFSRLDNYSVSPWVKKLKLGDNGQ